jgi:hypothetical protein
MKVNSRNLYFYILNSLCFPPVFYTRTAFLSGASGFSTAGRRTDDDFMGKYADLNVLDENPAKSERLCIRKVSPLFSRRKSRRESKTYRLSGSRPCIGNAR